MILKRIKPLFYNSQNELIVSKGHKVYIFKNGSYVFLFSFPVQCYKKIFSLSKLWSRLFRYGVMTAIEFDGAYYFTFNGYIYRYDLQSEFLEVDHDFTKGRGPLNFTIVKGIKGFEDGLYFGEYFSNREKGEVHIFKRKGTWNITYTFQPGELNHIHAIVVDNIREGIWVLSGDFNDSSAIYLIKDGFNEVTPVVKGLQKYRSCVAFPTYKGLLYATDTQIESNSVRMLRKENDRWVSDKLYDINGSCIYGCELKDYYIFSTSTEPCERSKNILFMLFDNKPAPAIKRNLSEVLCFSKKNSQIKTIREFNKDIFPYRLFQFGTVMFPAGLSPDNSLYMYSIGGKKLDLSTEFIKLK